LPAPTPSSPATTPTAPPQAPLFLPPPNN
jgi:hypothetical protein